MSSERQYPSSRYAWYMVVILTLAYVLSYVDRSILGLLVEPIKADLGLTDFQMGLLGGPAFAVFYATMGLPLGYAADRARRTWIVAAGVFVWSFATAASGLASKTWHMFAARMSVGVGEATLGPCAMSMIADSFPRERRGRPIAFYTAALSVGAGIASLVSASVITWAKTVPEISVPMIGTVAPWQLTFFIVGVPGLLLALLFLTLREPKRQVEIKQDSGGTFSMLLHHVGQRWFVYLSFLAVPCLMTITAYMQYWYAPMFERTWGWPAEKYALVNAVVLLAVGPLTVNVAGWLNDKMYSEGRRDAPLVILVCGAALIVPTAIAAPLMPSAELAFAWIVFNTIGIATASATGVTGLLNITPSEIRGQVTALYYLTISMAGLFLGPPTVGFLSDRWAEENLYLATAAVPAMFGIPILLLVPFALRAYRREIAAQTVSA
ncbi:MAG: MFS transporter [Pseudomonadota bacterium]